MQFIIFIYKKYHAILLSGLKIGKAFKMQKWISHLCRLLSRKFYVTSGNDVYLKMTQYGTSTTFSFTEKGCTKSRSGVRSREQKGLVTHPDSGPEIELKRKTISSR
jgi:hypothetical protein